MPKERDRRGLHHPPEVVPAPQLEVPKARRSRPWLFIAIVAIAAGQVLLPYEKKPFYLAGDAAAMFHTQLFDEVNNKGIQLAEEQAIAGAIASFEVSRAQWRGICGALSAFDGQAGGMCRAGVENYHDQAIGSINAAPRRYGRGY